MLKRAHLESRNNNDGDYRIREEDGMLSSNNNQINFIFENLLSFTIYSYITYIFSESTDPVTIGIHVRRGMDVVAHSRNLKHGHRAADKSYYDRAMRHFADAFSGNVGQYF